MKKVEKSDKMHHAMWIWCANLSDYTFEVLKEVCGCVHFVFGLHCRI